MKFADNTLKKLSMVEILNLTDGCQYLSAISALVIGIDSVASTKIR